MSTDGHHAMLALMDENLIGTSCMHFVKPSPATALYDLYGSRFPLVAPFQMSHDGKNIVFYDASKNAIVICNNGAIKSISTDWVLTRPFSWSSDYTKAACYYAETMDADDANIQKHGVAVVATDGSSQIIIDASKSVGTPRSDLVKNVPLGWGAGNSHIYYTDGLPQDDPDYYSMAGILYPPTATYRIDIKSLASTKVGLGDLSYVSASHNYIILYPSPVSDGRGGWKRGATYIELDTNRKTYLPEGIIYPQLSPSGKYVACLGYESTVRFYDTTKWQQFGEAVSYPPVITISDWPTHFRWVTNLPIGEPASMPAEP